MVNGKLFYSLPMQSRSCPVAEEKAFERRLNRKGLVSWLYRLRRLHMGTKQRHGVIASRSLKAVVFLARQVLPVTNILFMVKVFKKSYSLVDNLFVRYS